MRFNWVTLFSIIYFIGISGRKSKQHPINIQQRNRPVLSLLILKREINYQ